MLKTMRCPKCQRRGFTEVTRWLDGTTHTNLYVTKASARYIKYKLCNHCLHEYDFKETSSEEVSPSLIGIVLGLLEIPADRDGSRPDLRGTGWIFRLFALILWSIGAVFWYELGYRTGQSIIVTMGLMGAVLFGVSFFIRDSSETETETETEMDPNKYTPWKNDEE